ncbi:MAG: response regulator, partial [Rhodospirillaceae bacterium]|nr:response regulator [Rhodospirillaceae bacterium]
LDAANGETVFSPHLYRMLGLPATRPASATLLLDRFAPGDRGELARALEAARGGTDGARGVYRSVEIDGVARWFAVTLAAERNHQNRPLEIFGTVRDVTARKAAEDELAAARAEAEAAGRAKSGVLSLLGHAVRAPLNGVAGTLNLLDRTHLRPRDARTIDQARQDAERLRTAIDDAVEFARLEAGRIALEPGPFDPRLFLREAVSFWSAAAAERGLRIAWTADVMVPEWLIADAGRLRQILDKLVDNAIAVTEHGGVDIAMDLDRPAPGNGAEAAATHRVRLSVRDSGPGIPEGERQRVLAEPFQEAGEDAAERPGLGLAICRHLCTLMGGTLDFDSTPGGGTTFCVEVPLQRADAAMEAAARALASPGETGNLPKGLRVLVAEDNPASRAALRHALARHGWTVDLAGDGREAVEAVAARPYHVVLMDVAMPGMGGPAATRHIWAEHNSPPPVIGLAVHPSPEDVERFRAAGMAEVIAKPAPLEVVAAAIARVVGTTKADPDAVDDPPPQIHAPDEPLGMPVGTLADLPPVLELPAPPAVEPPLAAWQTPAFDAMDDASVGEPPEWRADRAFDHSVEETHEAPAAAAEEPPAEDAEQIAGLSQPNFEDTPAIKDEERAAALADELDEAPAEPAMEQIQAAAPEDAETAEAPIEEVEWLTGESDYPAQFTGDPLWDAAEPEAATEAPEPLFEPPGQYWGAPDVPTAEPAEEPLIDLPTEERAEPAEEAAAEWSDAASPEMVVPDGDEEAAEASLEVPEEPALEEPAEIVAEAPAEPEPEEPAETVAEAAAEPEPEVLSEPAVEAPAETSTEAPETPAEDAAEDTEDTAPQVAEPAAVDEPVSEHAAPYAFGPAGRP